MTNQPHHLTAEDIRGRIVANGTPAPVLCSICELDGLHTEAIRRVIETDGAVCRGHVVPTLLAGYGVEPL